MLGWATIVELVQKLDVYPNQISGEAISFCRRRGNGRNADPAVDAKTLHARVNFRCEAVGKLTLESDFSSALGKAGGSQRKATIDRHHAAACY